MADVISVVKSFPVFQFLTWLLGPIWHDPIGRTALLSVMAYIVGYSIYTGYLSHFTGGFGGLSFSRLGVELSDLITLLPSALLTVVKVLPRGIKTLLAFVGKIFLCFLLPLIVGIVLGLFMQAARFNPENWVFQLGVLVYSLAAWASCYFLWKENKLWLIIFGIIQLIGAALLSMDVTLVTTGPGQASTQINLAAPMWLLLIDDIVSEVIIVVWLLLIFFLLPMVFGKMIGEISVEERVLSQITGLVLKQPLSLLQEYERIDLVASPRISFWKQLCMIKKAVSPRPTPEAHTYIFPEGVSLFLIDTFKNTIACYLTIDSGIGRLILIDKEAFLAMSLEPARRKLPLPPV